eukprot:4994406-Prymnesium_polylepis.1
MACARCDERCSGACGAPGRGARAICRARAALVLGDPAWRRGVGGVAADWARLCAPLARIRSMGNPPRHVRSMSLRMRHWSSLAFSAGGGRVAWWHGHDSSHQSQKYFFSPDNLECPGPYGTWSVQLWTLCSRRFVRKSLRPRLRVLESPVP